MTLEKDTLHVVIRLPFKRPPDFVEPPPILWTDEMEQRLRQYMSQKHTDWNYIAEQLGVPTSYLIRHAAFIYETQLLGIKQFRFLNEVGKTPTPPPIPHPSSSTSSSSHQQQQYRRNILSQSSRPSSRRQITSSITPTGTILQQTPPQDPTLLDKGKSPVDSMMLSAISNIAPRTNISTASPPQQQQHIPSPQLSSSNNNNNYNNNNDISSLIEESLYKSFASQKSSRTYYSPQQSMGNTTSDSDKDKNEQEDDDDDGVEITEQFQNLQLEEEPAFLPPRAQVSSSSSSSPSIRPREQRRLVLSTFSSRSNKPTNNHKTSSSSSRAGESTGSSLDWSDSSITQSALEDAIMSKFNNGSKMSSLAFSRKYPLDPGKSNDT